MVIRRANLGDVESIIKAAKLATDVMKTAEVGLVFDADGSRPFFRMAVSNPVWVVLVVEVQGTFAGTIGAQLVPWFGNVRLMIMLCQWWYVLPEYRASRVAVRLLDQLETIAEEMEVATLSMTAWEETGNSEKLRRFYDRRGFQMCQRDFVKRVDG